MYTRFLIVVLLLASNYLSMAQRPTLNVVQPPAYSFPPAPAAGAYRFRTDSIMVALDKTQIPTGVLYDRVFPLSRLDVFGQNTTDTSRFEHFLQANQELWYASYRNVGLGASAILRARAAQHLQAGLVPIGLLHYSFNLLDTLAVQNNLLSQPGGNGGVLYDVAGRSQSPYLTRETLVAAVLAETVPTGTVQFGLPFNLRFDNTSNPVQSLTLNFNDGSASATLTPGSAGIYKSYSVAGAYSIELTAHFANGSSKTTFTRIQVKGETVAYRGDENPDFLPIDPCDPSTDVVSLDAGISFNDYEGRDATGFGEVTTYYANCNNPQLTKPVIMLDGIDFDDEDARNGRTVYSEFLNYYDQGTPKRLGEELRTAEYDIVILDFPGANGAEYIQRNAFVLIQLIQNINADLRSRSITEKLTVIGPSMSGLVSRYALAEMERRFNDASNINTYQKVEWNHNTRLWLSFDSPQLGANIPMGDQRFVQYYAEVGEVESAKKNLKNILQPATKQMLVHHYETTSNTVSGAPGFRDRFQAEMDNLGMPTQLRRIAVINGSIAGIRQDWRNQTRKSHGCDLAFTFEAKTGRPRLFHINWLPSSFPVLLPLTLSSASVKFTPDYGGTCTTFEAKLLGSRKGEEITVGRPNSISYDVAPGSWRSTQRTLADKGTLTDDKLNGFAKNFFLGGVHRATQTSRFNDVVDKHCFIPTVSALALTNSNRDLGQNLSTTDLVCSGETPFDSYYAPVLNEEHIFITPENAEYIKNEIRMITPKPKVLNFPSAFCPNGSAQFSVVPECVSRAGQPGTIYAWTTSDPGLLIISGQGTTNVTVQAQPGFSGAAIVSVTATRQDYTESEPLEQSLFIGTPPLIGATFINTDTGEEKPLAAANEDNNYAGSRVVSFQFPFENGITYSLAVEQPSPHSVFSGFDPRLVFDLSYPNVIARVFITKSGPCGPTTNDYYFYYDPSYRLVSTPNPVSDELSVQAISSDTNQPLTGVNQRSNITKTMQIAPIFDATLFDSYGRPVKVERSTNGQAKLDVRKLPNGLYLLRTGTGKNARSEHIQITH